MIPILFPAPSFSIPQHPSASLSIPPPASRFPLPSTRFPRLQKNALPCVLPENVDRKTAPFCQKPSRVYTSKPQQRHFPVNAVGHAARARSTCTQHKPRSARHGAHATERTLRVHAARSIRYGAAEADARPHVHPDGIMARGRGNAGFVCRGGGILPSAYGRSAFSGCWKAGKRKSLHTREGCPCR